MRGKRGLNGSITGLVSSADCTILTAAGRKDLQNLIHTLSIADTVSCRVWDWLSRMNASFASNLLPSTSPTVSKGEPRTELNLMMTLSSFFLSPSVMLLLRDGLSHYRRGPQSPQKVETSLILPVECIRIMVPVQFIVQVNPQVLKWVQYLYVPFLNVYWWGEGRQASA